METPKTKIPICEDLLFMRRLERNLIDALEKINSLLLWQVKLLEERKELMAEVHAAVQQRWADEDSTEQESSDPIARKEVNHEGSGELH
jgi:hypothetical protein